MRIFFITVVVAAVAAAQQFEQERDFIPAVRLAGLGFFQQSGGSRFISSGNNDNQIQSSSFQSSSNQGANLRSGVVSNVVSSQSGSFQANKQFQSSTADRSQFQSSAADRRQFESSATDRNQFQNQQSSFSANTNPQIRGITIQSVVSQQGSGNRFQPKIVQENAASRFQSSTSQQNNDNRFQTLTSQQRAGNLFQNNANQQTANSQFQSNFNQQDAASRSQVNRNNLVSQQSQFQTKAFQRSGSSFETSAEDLVSGVFEPLNLPSGASVLLGSISTSFSCVDRPYGYYADQDNSCRVFHVCNPALFSDGAVQTYQYSFMCGEGTMFDQKEMTCVVEAEATPCQEASNYYFRNAEFGRPEDKQF